MRRRTSLDNSCLSASDTFAVLISEDDKSEFTQKERRLSLGSKLEVTITFLAVNTTPEQVKENKRDLDEDGHGSIHIPVKGRPSSHSKTSKASDTINTSSYSSMVLESESEDSESEENSVDDDDDESDCDSFCDASVGEPANRQYLRSDLGGSVMCSDDSWDNGDFLQDSFSSRDSPPGKPLRVVAGTRGVFRHASLGSVGRQAGLSNLSSSFGSPSSSRRSTNRHVSLKVMDQVIGPNTDL